MHGSAVFAEEHDFQIDPRDTQSAEEKRENSGTPWKEKNRERVKEGMRIRIADYGETEEEREEEAEGEGDKSGYMDAKERRIYRQRGRERGGKRGPVSVSLQFRAVVRRCTQPFAYESGSEKRTERVLKRVCGGHDTRTNNRSQLCKSRCGGVMSWKKRRENEKEEDGPLAQMHARARIIRLTRLEGALRNGIKFGESRVTLTITVRRTRNLNASTIASRVEGKPHYMLSKNSIALFQVSTTIYPHTH